MKSLLPPDRLALRAYLRVCAPHIPTVLEELGRIAAERPDWKAYLDAQPSAPAAAAADEAQLHALQARAILDDAWEPYLSGMRAYGAALARGGVSYRSWLEGCLVLRDLLRARVEAQALDAAQLAAARRGLEYLVDLMVATIGDAYVAASLQVSVATAARYRTLFEQSPLPMWMYDQRTLAFIAVNDAALRHYGYARAEMLGMTIADIRAPEERAALRAAVAGAHGLTGREVWRHLKRDGTSIEVEVVANEFVSDDRPVRLVVVNDVTEREATARKLRTTEEQLRHAQKMEAIGTLAGGVAHDFNNILTVIESYACLVEEALATTDGLREDVLEIRRAAERAKAITRQLLTVSRRASDTPVAFQLEELLREDAAMLQRLAGEHVRVVIQPAPAPAVLADPRKIEQVIMNLALNARDAMPAGGRVVLTTEAVDLDADDAAARALAPGRYVMLAVTDTGCGMDAETQARIFDPFFTTKEAGKGTGLGLAIVHGIVAQAGGAITVYSKRGHGTTFRVYVPVADAAAAAAPKRPACDAPAALPPVTVLVVDEQLEIRAVVCRVLRAARCQVIDAATEAEALRLCVTHDGPIDVVLVDVVPGDTRGERLLDQLRELRPEVSVVVMSGYPMAARAPMLAKPFSPGALRAAIAAAVTRDGAREDARVPATRPAPGARTCVLVADDDDTLRRAVVRTLRRAGHEVVEVEDGPSAIRALETRAFDVVLSDVHMPGSSGLDLLRAIRRIDLDVPVLLMSGRPDVDSAAAAVEYGAFRYLQKPLEPGWPTLVQQAARAHALARIRRQAVATTGAHAGAADRAGLEVRFESALAQLWLARQPIFDARTGARFGVEVLVRSHEATMASPPALLDAATQLDRLPQLGRKIRRLAAGAVEAPTVVFVNLHPADLADIELVAAEAPLTQIADRVVLEVTERAALGSSPELTARVARLRALGFRIAIDDIGAGYSGLTSFTELVPEIVKLDQTLVRNIHANVLKQRTVGALCRLCHDVGSVVVGEGIEALEERDCLIELGCDLLQGYLLGRPA